MSFPQGKIRGNARNSANGNANGRRRPKLFGNDLQFDNLAAGSLDFRLSGSGKLLRGNRDGAGNFSVAENLEKKIGRTKRTGLDERIAIDFRAFALVDLAKVYDRKFDAVDIVESAMRKFAVKRHLTAFKARANAAAGASLHPFVSATGRFAVTAGTTATKTFVGVGRTFDFRKRVKFHRCENL